MKIYNDFETALKTRLTMAGVFKTMAWYNEQDENTDSEKAIAYPAVFYQLAPVDWHQLGNGHQSASAVLEITIVTHTLTDTPNIVFSLAEAAHKQLSGKALIQDDVQLTTAMVRRRTDFYGNRFKMLKKARIEYLFELFDHNLTEPTTEVTASLNLTA